MKPRELKKLISAEGFQVFRTAGTRLVLADRVRENLILDSGVAVEVEEPYRVSFTTRAQARDYPAESAEQMFERARSLGGVARTAGYAETETAVVTVTDPGDDRRILDTWYQVTFEKGGLSLAHAVLELRYAMSLKKQA